jgi:SNF2 family DNA or RNA helicase
LKELWALFAFLALPTRPEGSGGLVQGRPRSGGQPKGEPDGEGSPSGEGLKALGDWPSFKRRFADPIERARHADADPTHQQVCVLASRSPPLGRLLSFTCLPWYRAKVGRRRAAELRRILGPRILQRSKDSLATRPEAADQAAANAPDDDASTATASAPGASSSSSSSSGCPSLPPKHEVVLWVGLSAQQRRAYEQYLKGNAVQKV